MHVVAADRSDDLAPHAEAWDALAASLPQCVPMLSHAWIATYLEQQVEPDGHWLCLFAYEAEGGRLVGVLPVVVAPAPPLGMRWPRLLVPCHYHTTEGDVLLAPDRARDALRALLDALRARVPRLLAVEMGGVRDDSPTNATLATRVPGWSVVREFAVEGSTFRVEGSAEAWLRGLSRNLRSDLKRFRNRIRKDGLGEERAVFLEAGDATPDPLDSFLVLEASGWKGREGMAIAGRPENVRKYRVLAERFAARRQLEWHRLELGGRTVAAHMAVRMGRNLMLLRQGYDAELSRYGVGNLLLQHMVEREFARGGDSEVNLVTDYPWCRRWRMDRRRYDRIHLLPRRPLPYLLGVLPFRARVLARRLPAVRRFVGWWRGSAKEPHATA